MENTRIILKASHVASAGILFFFVIASILSIVFALLLKNTFAAKDILSLGFLSLIFLWFLFLALSLYKAIFYTISFDFDKKIITVPFWEKIDQSEKIFLTSSIRFFFLIFSARKQIPFSAVSSIILDEESKLLRYLPLCKNDPYLESKISNFIAEWKGQQESAPAATPSNLVDTSSTIVAEALIKAAAPEHILLIRTKNVCIIRTLTLVNRKNFSFLVERLGQAGVPALVAETA